ncbi:hypothetical protein Taro_035682 [Colocasia esculenta]|uniref:Uncharacterized protein n=1 Tax=Colocasia esculenta TaxID=4460 RepID=A0A843VZK2_COLES|nr:hypothetical protein [Colocasia esculenta]
MPTELSAEEELNGRLIRGIITRGAAEKPNSLDLERATEKLPKSNATVNNAAFFVHRGVDLVPDQVLGGLLSEIDCFQFAALIPVPSLAQSWLIWVTPCQEEGEEDGKQTDRLIQASIIVHDGMDLCLVENCWMQGGTSQLQPSRQ